MSSGCYADSHTNLSRRLLAWYCIYVCMYVCMYMVIPTGRITSGTSGLVRNERHSGRKEKPGEAGRSREKRKECGRVQKE